MAKEARRAPINWRLWTRAGVWTLLAASTVMAARAVTRFAYSDPHFTLDRDAGVAAKSTDFTILGLERASRSRVLRVFENDFGANVFQIPIDERRRKLLAVDWVERASVSRIWPNRLVVRIWERQPVAFVNLTPAGTRNQTSRLSLIDAYGVILDRPEKLNFSSPIVSGVSESQTERERQQRVHHYMRLMDELGPLGKQVAEVDVRQAENLTIGMEIEGREIELVMGDRNFKRRLGDFLDHYAEIHKRSPGATSFDLRLDDRITTKETE
jgi:cell division protein FtsQ